jgi:hypothetical protein
MNTWFQRSDLSSIELVINNEAEALKKWSEIQTEVEDQLMLELEAKNEEFCLWGLGLENEDGVDLHIYRESPKENTYSMRVAQNHKENYLDSYPSIMVPVVIKKFYNEWSTLISN